MITSSLAMRSLRKIPLGWAPYAEVKGLPEGPEAGRRSRAVGDRQKSGASGAGSGGPLTVSFNTTILSGDIDERHLRTNTL